MQWRLSKKKSIIGVPADVVPISPSAMDHIEELLFHLWPIKPIKVAPYISVAANILRRLRFAMDPIIICSLIKF